MAPLTTYVSTWQEFIANEESRSYPINASQISALKAFFNSPTTPISDIAHQICAPIISVLEQPQSVQEKYEFGLIWRTIADAIRCLSEYNDRLVELVAEIAKVEDPIGYIAYMQDFRQCWNEFVFNYKDPPSTDPLRETKRKAWLNLNLFDAKLSTKGIPRLDERMNAPSVMRIALEKTPNADEITALDGYIPAAAVWFKINGKGIYEMEGPIEDEYPHNPTDWKGARGWSKERFEFWRKRFEEISKIEALKSKTREAAKEAAEIMEKIQKPS